MSVLADRTLSLTLAAAVAAAISVAAPPEASAQGVEKCFGIAKAGENDCANASGTHSCAGLSKMDYDGTEWALVPVGTCETEGGQLEAFEGVGQPK